MEVSYQNMRHFRTVKLQLTLRELLTDKKSQVFSDPQMSNEP